MIRQIFILTLIVCVQSATINVAISGVDSSTCGSAIQPCRTISRALQNATQPGDEVIVRSGQYAETELVLGQKGIVVRSTGSAEITLSYSRNQRGFVFSSSSDSTTVVDGFTISHCNVSNTAIGGLVDVAGGGTIRNSILSSCSSTTGSAVRLAPSSKLTLDNVHLNGHQSDSAAVVTVESGAYLTMVNVTFDQNTLQTGTGGAIRINSGSVNATNVIFRQNILAAGSGGAVYGSSATFVGQGLTCENNGGSGTTRGGAFSFHSSRVNISESVFDGHQISSSSGMGGVFEAKSGSEMRLIKTTIKQSKAWIGGVFYISTSFVYMERCTVMDNTAVSEGSGVFRTEDSVSSEIIIKSSDFKRNKAETSDGLGGLGDLYKTRLEMSDSSVSDGSCYSACMFDINSGSSVILNSVVVSDMTAVNRAPICYVRDGGALEVHNTTMTNLQASGTYGGIYGSGGTVLLEDSKISNSIADDNGSNGRGGALSIRNDVTSAVIRRCVFEANTATSSGGALYLDEAPSVVIEDTVISNCLVPGSGYGGGIYMERSESKQLSAVLKRVTLQNNTAEFGGGVYVYDTTNSMDLTLDSCVLDGNKATDRGGGFYFGNSGIPWKLIGQNVIRNCVAENNGGGIYCLGGQKPSSKFTFNITNFAFSDNVAVSGRGGGVAAFGFAQVRIDGTIFDGNSAGLEGGALQFTAASLVSTQSQYRGNRAKSGGAIGLDAIQTYDFHDITFGSNAADEGGGSIVLRSGKLTISSSTFYNDTGTLGGSIYVSGVGTLVATDVNVTASRAGYGGALYDDGSQQATMDKCHISGCSATGAGGSIALAAFSQLEMSLSSLHGSTAQLDGGAMATSEFATFTASDCDFVGNTANRFGGFMLAEGFSKSYATRCMIKQNSAVMGGGATLSAGARSELTLTQCNVTRNVVRGTEGTNGGGGFMLVDNGKVVVLGSTIDYNTAAKGAAAMVSGRGVISMSDSVIEHNQAVEGGGGVWFSTMIGDSALNRDVFRNNSAPNGGGGAVLWAHSAYTVSPTPPNIATCQFLFNTAAYGDRIASEGYRLFAPISNVTTLPQTSGSNFDSPMQVQLLDWHSQVVRSVQATIKLSTNATDGQIEGQDVVEMNHGIALVSASGLTAKPGDYHTISFTSSMTYVPVYHAVVLLRPCRPGEWDDPLHLVCTLCQKGYNSSLYQAPQCYKCPKGHYADQVGSSTCKPCPKGTAASFRGAVTCVTCSRQLGEYASGIAQQKCSVCPANSTTNYNLDGCTCNALHFELPSLLNDIQCPICPVGAQCSQPDQPLIELKSKRGYWRATNTTQLFVECPQPVACPGGGRPGAINQCAKGYGGPVCGVCELTYGQTSDKSCVKCGHGAVEALISILVLVAVMVFVGFTVRRSARPKSPVGIVLKMFMNFLQLESLIANFPIWKDTVVTQLLSVFDAGSSPPLQLPSIECMLDRPSYFSKMIMFIVLPVVVIIIPGLIFGTYFLIRTELFPSKQQPLTPKKKAAPVPMLVITGSSPKKEAASPPQSTGTTAKPRTIEQWKARMTMWTKLSILVLLFLLYPSVAKVLLQAFVCTQTDTNKYYLVADMRIECYATSHMVYQVVATVFLIVYSLGIPLGAITVLHRNRKGLLKDPRIIQTYGFLYLGFKKNRYYWEAVPLMRKILLIFLIVFFTENRIWQAFAANWIIEGALLLQLFAAPFVSAELNMLEAVSLVTTWVTLNIGLFNFSRPATGGESVLDVMEVILFITNIATATAFTVYMGHAIFKKAKETGRLEVVKGKIQTRTRALSAQFRGKHVSGDVNIREKPLQLASWFEDGLRELSGSRAPAPRAALGGDIMALDGRSRTAGPVVSAASRLEAMESRLPARPEAIIVHVDEQQDIVPFAEGDTVDVSWAAEADAEEEEEEEQEFF